MMMPLCGVGAACAVIGFPKTKLVDDSPLIGAGASQWSFFRARWGAEQRDPPVGAPCPRDDRGSR